MEKSVILVNSGDWSGNLCYTDHPCVCVLEAGFSHTHSFIFHIPHSLCHIHTNSCILKAAHTHAHSHTCTCSEPDLYLLLYPVSLGAPCPAHMIAPFPGPLLPAFTLFPWQLSFKWVEHLLSARLVKNSFPKSDTGNQLLLSRCLSFLLGVTTVSPLTVGHTYCVHLLQHTHIRSHTHIESF